MIAITILGDNISKSLFRFKNGPERALDELPEKLLLRVTRVLTILSKYNVTVIEHDYHTRELKYSYTKLDYPLLLLVERMSEEDSIFEVTDVLDDFDWYLSPHFYSNQNDRLGGKLICRECNNIQPQGVPHSETCAFSPCPSHEKWARIIEGYSAPEDMIKKAWMGIPRTGSVDEWGLQANKWSQQG